MSDHPDFEALSASLDGEDEGAAAHAAGCATCQAQLAGLRAVRDAVGGQVASPASEVVDAAVARAVASAGEWAAGEAPAITPAAWPPPGRERRVPTPAQPRPGARWRLRLTGSAAAAAVAVVVLAAVLVSGGSRTPDDDTALSAGPPNAAQETARSLAPTGSAEGGSAEGGSAAAGTAGGSGGYDLPVQELGDVGDISALRERAAARAAPSAPVGATATDAALPAPRIVGTRVCEIEARTARPSLGVVVYVANLRFQGTPVVALGFAPAPDGTPVTLLVLAPGEGCRVLAETTIP
jgi:hypothetical protein